MDIVNLLLSLAALVIAIAAFICANAQGKRQGRKEATERLMGMLNG